MISTKPLPVRATADDNPTNRTFKTLFTHQTPVGRVKRIGFLKP